MKNVSSVPIIPQIRPGAKTLQRLRQAEADGYRLGRLDIHRTPANFHMPEEWVAWLAGWRRGQAELRAKQRARGLVLL